MRQALFSNFLHPDPAIRRELVDLLYTALPQVMAINVTSVLGASALAVITHDTGYIVIAFAILINAIGRVISLLRYKQRPARLSDKDVILWERIYCIGASAFGLALGALSFRAFQLNDAPGIWIAFGLSMSYCVGMVSRAAIRPWIVLTASAVLLAPTMIAGFLRPEPAYQLGAGMLVLFWFTIREASRHLSTAFIERLEAKHALLRQANHDFLTGLPNRAAFLNELQAAAETIAIVAIDLDGFKPVNDRHGHHAGDDLLRQVATRLTRIVGPVGMAARFGGDEFMLLLPVALGPSGREQALALAHEAVLTLSMPFLVGELPILIGASAGLLVSAGSLSDTALSPLLQQVDRALYVAKRAGGGSCVWADNDAEPTRRTA